MGTNYVMPRCSYAEADEPCASFALMDVQTKQMAVYDLRSKVVSVYLNTSWLSGLPSSLVLFRHFIEVEILICMHLEPQHLSRTPD